MSTKKLSELEDKLEAAQTANRLLRAHTTVLLEQIHTARLEELEDMFYGHEYCEDCCTLPGELRERIAELKGGTK